MTEDEPTTPPHIVVILFIRNGLHHALPNISTIMPPLARQLLTVRATPERHTASSNVEVDDLDPTGSPIRMSSLAISLVVRLTALDGVLVAKMRKIFAFQFFAFLADCILRAREKGAIADTNIGGSTVGTTHAVWTKIAENRFVDFFS